MLSTSVKDFYDQQTVDWNKSRQQSWAGLESILTNKIGLPELENIKTATSLLELGCGNGRLLSNHLEMLPALTDYTGVDISSGLLGIAAGSISKVINATGRDGQISTKLLQADLTSRDWAEHLPNKNLDLIIMIATLHHIPAQTTPQLFAQISSLIKPGGLFIMSSWQFLPELEHLVLKGPALQQYLETSQLKLADADYILSWQKSSNYRYAHLYSEVDILPLLAPSRLSLLHKFSADGRSGKLNDSYI